MDPESIREHERIERLKQAMYSRGLSEKLTAKDRRELSDQRETVGDDWKRPETPLRTANVAPRGVGAGRFFLYSILVAAILFALGAVGFFGYYFFLGGGSFPASPNNVDIVISGPQEVQGGEPTELQVVVTNRNQVPLQLADLVLTYPPGTRSPADLSTDLPNYRISLGTIEPGGRRQGTVSAVFAGQQDTRGSVKAELEYRTTGSGSIFVANTNYAFSFRSSPLTLTVDANKEVISGQQVQLTIKVSSNTNAPVKDVVIAGTTPFGFKVTSASPNPTVGTTWAIGDLAPGQSRTITLIGTLNGDGGVDRVFKFNAGTRTDRAVQAVTTSLASVEQHVTISQPFLKLTTAINNSQDSNATVKPGDKVTVVIGWQNNLPTEVTNAIIVAKLSGLQIEGSTVRSEDGFFRSSDDSVFWDKTTTKGALASLPAGAKGTVAFTFTMPTSDMLKHLVNPKLTLSINAAGNRVSESGVPQGMQSTAHSTISLGTDLQLIVEGLYYTNPFGSTGPMPPKASAETTYALVFTVRNTTNPLTGAVLTATLPPYVRWVGTYSPSSEDVTFNSRDGSIRWKVGDLAPGVGLDAAPARQIAIAVGLTPSTSQIGGEPALLQNIQLTASDASSTAAITRTVGDVTTNLARVQVSDPSINVVGDQGFNSTNAAVVR